MAKKYLQRVERLKQRLLNIRPEMDLENARLLTEGFREAEALPLILKKAHAVKNNARKKLSSSMRMS